MMSKIRKMQDTWVAKSIFILTALSFMSLFGISGYISSAGQNRTVIKVNDIEISQGEFSYLYDKELSNVKKMFNGNIEMTDSIRNTLLLGLVQREVANAVIATAADKYDIVIGNDLIRKIIYSQQDFMGADGKFDINRFKMMLSAMNWSEQDYINALRSDLQLQMLVQNPAARINVPDFMLPWLGKIENQKRIFSYIRISPEKQKLDRKMSNEELQQYYADFGENFMTPEKRDASYITLSMQDISGAYTPSEAEIDAYYKENISRFEIPEKRTVLQMVFDSKEKADEAVKELKSGNDFYAVAQKLAGQNKQDTELGSVSKDMLIAEIANDVFTTPVNGLAGPVKSEFGWHLIKVTAVIPAKKTDKSVAKQQIIAEIRKEKAYDQAYELTSELEDKIGAGSSLEALAAELKTPVHKITGLTEDGKSASGKAPLPTEITDAIFSYNVGEISQVIETETGLAIIRPDKIDETHMQSLEALKPQLTQIWAANERDAITQELVNDIMNDLENGEKITDSAKRFKQSVITTRPLGKTESFETLPSSQMETLFRENAGTPKLIDYNGDKIIAVTTKVVEDNSQLSDSEKADIRNKFRLEFDSEISEQLINSYSSDYDVRIKYKLLGLAD